MDTHHLVELPSNTPRPEVDFEQIDQWIVEGLNAHAASVVGSELLLAGRDKVTRLRLEMRSIHLMLGASLDVQILGMAQAILDQAHQLQDPLGLVEAWNTLGQVQGRLRLPALALQSMGHALSLAETSGLPEAYWQVQTAYLRVLYNAEMHEEQIKRGEALLADAGFMGRAPVAYRLSLLSHVAAAHKWIGHLDSALSLQAQAVAMGERESSPPRTLSRLLGNYANALAWAGELVRSREMLDRAQDYAKLYEERPEQLLWLHQHEGIWAWKSQLHEQALHHFTSARALGEAHDLYVGLGAALLRQAECAEEVGHLRLALDARKALQKLTDKRLREQASTMSQGLSSLVESARMQTQNELLQAHGSELEKALAARNDELSRMLATLQQEVAVRKAAETALEGARQQLEWVVQERTAELGQSHNALMAQERRNSMGEWAAQLILETDQHLQEAIARHGQARASLASLDEHPAMSRLLQEALKPTAELLQASSASLQDAARLTAQAKQVTERVTREWGEVSLVTLCEGCLGSRWESFDSHQVEAAFDFRATANAQTDGRLLSQVLDELVDNALQHALASRPAGGAGARIELATWDGDGQVILAVRDNGSGLDAGTLTHWEAQMAAPLGSAELVAQAQAAMVSSAPPPPAGIGLRWCRQTVEDKLQGSLRLALTSDGGLEVRIHLPVPSPDQAEPASRD